VKIEYTLLSLFIALVYGIVKKFLPDFPISPDVLLTFLVYVLLKLGVEVIGNPVRSLFKQPRR
jgi:hypothetical protein